MHPCPHHNSVCVSRAYSHQSIHAHNSLPVTRAYGHQCIHYTDHIWKHEQKNPGKRVKAYASHIVLLRAQERGHSSVFYLPTPVVIPVGSRPITETRQQIDDSRLLKKFKKQKCAVYSDGNVNWRHACARLELEHRHATHQVKMFTKSIRPGSVSLSAVAGTQVLDRSWEALKKFLPSRIGAKRKLKGHSCRTPASFRANALYVMLADFSRRTVSNRVLAGPRRRMALTACEHSETLRPNDDVVRLRITMLSVKTKVVRNFPKSSVRAAFYNTKHVLAHKIP